MTDSKKLTAPLEKPRREAALTVTCPFCGSAPGEPCHGGRGERKAVHVERLALATRVRRALRWRRRVK